MTTVALKWSFTIKVAKNVSNVSYFVIFRFLDPVIFSIIASACCGHLEFRYSAKKDTCKTMSSTQVLFFDITKHVYEVSLLVFQQRYAITPFFHHNKYPWLADYSSI